MGGGGGGGKGGGSTPVYTAPEVKETPKAQTTKDVTEATTSARNVQAEKAKRAAGLKNAVQSGALNDSSTTASGANKTLLGQ